MTGKGVKGRLNGIILSIPLIFLAAKPGSFINKIFNIISPKPGQGPNKKEEKMDILVLDFLFLIRKAMNQFFKVTGDRDPGYGSTSKDVS